jgi:hypothetical protein
MYSTSNEIAMGGGGDGFAFFLDNDFRTGSSNISKTYGNPTPLVSNGDSFKIANLEVWGFENFLQKQKTIGKKPGYLSI